MASYPTMADVPGPGHYVAIVWGGRSVYADHWEGVVGHMREIRRAREGNRPPRQRDVDAVRAWLDRHAT